MDFKNTYTNKWRRQRGVTLAELMVAIGISGILLAAIGSLSLYTGRSFAGMANYVDLDRQSRNALDQMSWKIRNASRITSFSTNSVSFSYLGGTLSYSYDSSGKKLTENLNGATSVLLTDCNSFEFSAYQRNTKFGSFDQYITTTTSLIKEIQVSWSCSRKILGALINSESVQSAKIVLRNENQ